MQKIGRALDSIFSRNIMAEADVHDGAMIALLPAQKYVDVLALPGGEPPEELHITLLYLGKADQWEINGGVAKYALIDYVHQMFSGFPEINAEINAHAVFNPNGEEPASVYLIGGDGAVTCRKLHEYMDVEVHDFSKYSVDVPQDFPFYLPHLTIGYNFDISKLTYQGPITFDRVRIVFGGDATDIPLRKV